MKIGLARKERVVRVSELRSVERKGIGDDDGRDEGGGVGKI